MNAPSSSEAGVFAQTWADTLDIVRASRERARRHVGWAIGAILLSVVAAVLIFPHDQEWLAAIRVFRGDTEKTVHGIAWQLGRWGDYPTYNLPVAILIWAYGAMTNSRAWRRVAIVCFLGATLAGIFDDCFRLTLGRPRPDVYPAVPDGLYGPAKALLGRYQSFPSGHAASDFGMGVALLFVSRPLGLAATAYALLVVWARMEINKHYPSDVIVGSIVGIYFGVLVGVAARDGTSSAKARPINSRS